ncbi:uncharacterized protein LOC143212395 [Lasioglossum baleicum]|uniref:uncharacterized protein LOC143212395 n=1 Tax=Lasioglossum baleicum TaxID=434251 RepID=UPI003FCD03BC
MAMKLIISFYCNVIDEPEEILVLNVQDGKPVNIRLHGFRDPPVLRCYERYMPDEELDNAKNIRKSSIASHPELGYYSDEAESTDTVTSGDSEDWIHMTNRNVSFDCKKSFVGEKVRIPMKFKNIGGEGRFFVMSEIDWTSMYIEDITEENLLKIPPFAIWPAYFELKSQEEIILWLYFLPDSYGIHVDKLYVLSNNCTMMATEIFGDGVLYEPYFIQLSKVLTSSLRNSTVDIVVRSCRTLLTKRLQAADHPPPPVGIQLKTHYHNMNAL